MSDGTANVTTTFVVNVTAVNDVPTISTIATQTVNEDAAATAVNFTIGDVETAATALTVTRTTSNPAVIPLANVVLGGTTGTRSVTFTPTHSGQIFPGGSVVYVHTLSNNGNVAETISFPGAFAVDSLAGSGWVSALYQDDGATAGVLFDSVLGMF